MTRKNPLLLALDDDEAIVDIVAVVGRLAGFDVATATSADAFQAAFDARSPDIIVLDLQMPGVDGVQTLRRLAEKGCRAAIVLVTGMDERTIAAAEQYASSRGLPIVGSLQKPFLPEDLLQKLAAAGAAVQAPTPEDLDRAIEANELTVLYQPTIRRFADGTWDIAAMEALLRWDHPQRGQLGPEEFIGMGEAHGLSRAMTDYVIQRGVEQLKGWHALRLDLGLRVNVAATLISDIDFPDRLESILVAHGLEPSALTLEITETAMLDNDPDTLDILTRLRLKDINLAIDDFGIGYSSLTQLFRMPFNEMKIDKSLTLRVPQSKEAGIMVEALVQLAHKLNLTVCAEGVETQEALDFLGRVACDSAQGFLISRPIPAQDVPGVVRGWEQRQIRVAGA